MEDQGIVALFFDRSEQAIVETDKKYGGYCYSIAYNILDNREDSEESVSDTYLTAWNIIPPQRPSFLNAFLAKITRHISKVKSQQEAMFAQAQAGDTILTLEVPRLARSTQQLCEIIDRVREKHLRLVILGSITLDCREGRADPMSEAFLQMAGVFSQLELAMIRSRVRSGMENARAKGRQIGRPQVSKEDIPATFLRHYPAYKSKQLNISELARVCDISRTTVYKYIGLLEA